jgi:transcriptional regulator with XRE-family HTH domain
MKTTQQQIAEALNVTQAFVSMVLSEKKPISWPMADRLSNLFPNKSIKQWKNAHPDDIRRAFATQADECLDDLPALAELHKALMNESPRSEVRELARKLITEIDEDLALYEGRQK